MATTDPVLWFSEYVRGARRCDTPTALAAHTAHHLREVTGAEWSECVRSSDRSAVEVLASSDEDLTRELMRARLATEEPPDPHRVPETTVGIEDLAVASPWPSFAAQAVRATSARSAVLTYFSTDEGAGVLTVIDPRPAHFDALTRQQVRSVADLFSVLLDRLAGAARAVELEQAVVSGRRIGAACGMLAVRRGIAVDEAFRLLRDVSQRSHRKLRHVAAQVLEETDLPR